MPTPSTRKRNQRACTACRQVKHRCDSAETFPAACTRCQEKSLHCKTDPNFKRTKTRGRLVEVTTQLNAIQKALNEREISVDLATPSLVPSDHGISGIESVHELPKDDFYRYSTIGDLPSSPLSLGTVSLQNDQLRELFEHFKINYYYQFPILDTDMSLSQLHQSSAVLFWAVIIISSRWHPSLFPLYPSLVTGYRDILSKTLLEPMNTIESIQAILMFCVWPFDFWRKIEDPSWSYCGFATNAATRLRINESCAHGCLAKNARIRKKTWLACVHVNCVLSQGWLIGVPVLQELLTTAVTLHSPCTPSEQRFLAKVEILSTLSKSTSTISSLQNNSHAWNFALNLGSDLDSIREKHNACWDAKSEVLLLGAQICLYTLQLDLDSKSRAASELIASLADLDTTTERRNFIHTIYLTSLRLVHTFQNLSPAAHNPATPSSPYRHLPKFNFLLLVMSMAFIFKVRLIYYQALKLKPEDTDPHIRSIHDIFSSWTRDENDHAGRGVKLIDMILKAENKGVDLRGLVEGAGEVGEGNGNGSGSRRPGSVVLSDLVVVATRLREDAEREREAREREREARIAKEGNTEDGGREGEENMVGGGGLGDGCMPDVCFDWEIPWELDLLSQDPFTFLTGI
ncbi:hypothetical protein ONS96_002461 [Cadophora gregata f. sp. sojae]|nr:hypothetical protein ONS96_002461 [Cadophora gregata f. sp. sojae]